MTPEQVLAAADKYIKLLSSPLTPPTRAPSSTVDPDALTARKHLLWMCETMKAGLEGDGAPPPRAHVEKAMRWLGFIQGVLWTTQGVTIDEMKADNS